MIHCVVARPITKVEANSMLNDPGQNILLGTPPVTTNRTPRITCFSLIHIFQYFYYISHKFNFITITENDFTINYSIFNYNFSLQGKFKTQTEAK